MIASVFTGCGNSAETKDSGKAQTEQAATKEDAEDKAEDEKTALEDGTYTAEFQTDSSMFHVNEAMDGKGTLTVEDGKMTIHISLVSKNIALDKEFDLALIGKKGTWYDHKVSVTNPVKVEE